MIRLGVMTGLISFVTMCVHPRPDSDADDGPSQDDDAGVNDCAVPTCDNDEWEPNESSEAAAHVPWGEVSSWNFEEYWDATTVIDAFLCSGEDDWYFIPMAELGFDHHVVRVDGLVMGTSWCGGFDFCGGASLPEAPENTMAVEVHDATTMALLVTDVAADGRVHIMGMGESFAQDLLIRVTGLLPPATYAYELYVDVRSYEGEDECEC